MKISIFLAMLGVNVFLVVRGSSGAGLTDGFKLLLLKQKNFRIQSPYDVSKDQRYSFIDGVHKCWVYSTDKPHTPTSKTLPRTEISIHFEGYGYVPRGTSGVCIMQVFGATAPRATTLMVRVYNGTLTYYKRDVLLTNIYDKWFSLNVIHDVENSKLNVYIDGKLKLETNGRGGISHNFKCGVYAQSNDTN
ncbi:Citrate-binding protein [Linum perenne]